MNVYHDSNIWGKGKPETKLTALLIDHSFLWGGQKILIPAVYVGKTGAALDVCAKIGAKGVVYPESCQVLSLQHCAGNRPQPF